MGRPGAKRQALTDNTSEDNRGGKRKDRSVFPSASLKSDTLNEDLWQVCAGSLVYVPRTGDRVVYFPQGHIEQVEECAQKDGQMEVPNYNLPYKILCKIVSCHLKAEPQTDEVYAQITIIPEPKQDELTSKEEYSHPSPVRSVPCFYSKTLTPSDISTHGGFSLPRRLADECLPHLNMSQDIPTQELVAKDLHGFKWHFRHKYRGQPKRHLITSGWRTFLNAKKLTAGDSCIFLRGENGELRIGVRRAMNRQSNASASILSGSCMTHGILASASHAISTGTMFTVYYRPWTSPSEFIIPYDLYMQSRKINYSIRMRLRMHVEAEDCLRKRYVGTVVGIEDVDGAKWPGSEWNCIKVQWDASSDTFVCPERVSPWCIEPTEFHKRKSISSSRPRRGVYDKSLQEVSPPAKGDNAPHTCSTLHCHGQSSQAAHVQTRSLLSAALSLANPALNEMQVSKENQMHILLHNPLQQRSTKPLSFPDQKILNSDLPYLSPTNFTSNGACDSIVASRNASLSIENSIDSNSHKWEGVESKDENEDPLSQPDGSSSYRLFGVNLARSHQELPSPQIASSGKNSSPPPHVVPTSESSITGNIQMSEPSNSISAGVTASQPEKQWKKCVRVPSSSCTKVFKHGNCLGRSVDIKRFHDYDELISELDLMFDFKGSLVDGTSGWHVTYIDNVGDTMLVGDCPWQDFLSLVERMLVCPMEEFEKQNPD